MKLWRQSFSVPHKVIAVIFLSLLIQWGSAIYADTCDQACDTDTDCNGLPCPVCLTGYCNSCHAIGDQANCEDGGTGATTYCQWVVPACQFAPAYPELPIRTSVAVLLLGGIAILATVLINRRRLRKLGVRRMH